MKSIKTVFKIGNGPSSSHTVGPFRAAKYIKEKYSDADEIKVTLFGSLAFTGAGHGTEKAIKDVLGDIEITSNITEKNLPHPNTMVFEIFKAGQLIKTQQIISIGGGSIVVDGDPSNEDLEVYDQKNFSEILDECEKEGLSLSEFVYKHEGEEIKDYLKKIWKAMQECVERGLASEGILPGGLNITRKAKKLYDMRCYNENSEIRMDRMIASYAYAVSEENADEHVVVTAPTCGSCGVIPAVLYYMSRVQGYPEDEIIDALAVSAVIGNVIRTNASISGAECGCQAEIGSACSMAAAAIAHLNKMNLRQIEYSAEVAMEHHLGLTCDPVKGLVQIPCIERNAVAAMRALNAVNLARFLYETRRISFDDIVETMYQTGKDLSDKYRETSHGGLAVLHSQE